MTLSSPPLPYPLLPPCSNKLVPEDTLNFCNHIIICPPLAIKLLIIYRHPVGYFLVFLVYSLKIYLVWHVLQFVVGW